MNAKNPMVATFVIIYRDSHVPAYRSYTVYIYVIEWTNSVYWLGYGLDDRGSIPGKGN
jgi:hypothetical protein